jgi:predicted transglutaminase-like cysteine proteinase
MPDRSNDVRNLTFARSASWVGLYALLLALAIAASGQLGFSRSVTPELIAHYVRQYGPSARGRLEGWKGFVQGMLSRIRPVQDSSGEVELLSLVNRFFNGLPSSTDLALWGVEDYWATPSEFLAVGSGDCEDYVIAKYFALKELGIPIARLRVVYVKTWSSSQAAHMVLAYYPDPRADPLILDNLSGSIELASRRSDLTPVFSFNDEDLMSPGNDAMGIHLSGSSVRRWQDLTKKLERELTY